MRDHSIFNSSIGPLTWCFWCTASRKTAAWWTSPVTNPNNTLAKSSSAHALDTKEPLTGSRPRLCWKSRGQSQRATASRADSRSRSALRTRESLLRRCGLCIEVKRSRWIGWCGSHFRASQGQQKYIRRAVRSAVQQKCKLVVAALRAA